MARARARKPNPMPRRGAILIANGAARSKKSVDFKRVLARLKANGKKRKHNRRRHNRNPVALRMNGLAIRANGKRRRNIRRRRNPVALRMNGLAIRANGKKRKHNRRRHNGKKFMLFNRRRRNPAAGIVGSVEQMVRKVPVVGKFAAPIAVPAAAAAAIVGAVHYGIKMGMPYVPATVAGYVAPVGYTVGAAILGMAVQFVPSSILSPASKKSIAALAIAGGGAVDGIRYLSARESAAVAVPEATAGLGEGGYWQLAGDPDSSAVASMYRDCSYADAATCGPDLDPSEGEAAIAGARAWAATFPATIQVTRTADGGASRHAGKHGHRWGWAIASLGFPTFRKIAAMPAEQRVETLGRLRHHAMSAHRSASSGYGALVLAQ